MLVYFLLIWFFYRAIGNWKRFSSMDWDLLIMGKSWKVLLFEE